MKLAEKILAIAVLAGLLLMFSIVRGGAELFMISLLSLSGIYFAFGFILFNQIRLRDLPKKETFKDLTTIKIVFGAISGIALSIVCVGIVFKLLSLPGSNEMLLIGTVVCILISIATLVLRKKLSAATILTRTVVFGVVGIVLLSIPLLSIIKFQYRNHPAYVEAYTRYVENPKDESLWEKQMLEYNRVWMNEEEFKEYERRSQ